jgi:hypothetical protein
MQALPHFSYPSSQLMPQLPPAHVALPWTGSGQTMSQLPQWFGSDWVSMHAAAQRVSPPAQLSAHWPMLQTLPVGQMLSQAPQCDEFDCV